MSRGGEQAGGGKTNRTPRSQDSRGVRMAQHAAKSVLACPRRPGGLELEAPLLDVCIIEPRGNRTYFFAPVKCRGALHCRRTWEARLETGSPGYSRS
jgi:hypothetical protein